MADYTPEDVERGADAIHEGDCGCPDGREVDEYVAWSEAVLAAAAPAIAARARRAAIEEFRSVLWGLGLPAVWHVKVENALIAAARSTTKETK